MMMKASGCAASWIKYQDHCYYLGEKKVNWTDAKVNILFLYEQYSALCFYYFYVSYYILYGIIRVIEMVVKTKDTHGSRLGIKYTDGFRL